MALSVVVSCSCCAKPMETKRRNKQPTCSHVCYMRLWRQRQENLRELVLRFGLVTVTVRTENPIHDKPVLEERIRAELGTEFIKILESFTADEAARFAESAK